VYSKLKASCTESFFFKFFPLSRPIGLRVLGTSQLLNPFVPALISFGRVVTILLIYTYI